MQTSWLPLAIVFEDPWIIVVDKPAGLVVHPGAGHSDDTLAVWSERIADWRTEGRRVFAYFDNDMGCAAPGDALRLAQRISKALA